MTAKSARQTQPLKMLKQASNEHETMAEYITAALQTQALFETPHPSKKIKGMQSFLNDRVVRHFRFEEEEVFPRLAGKDRAATRRVIQRLKREHKTMLSQVASLQKKLSQMTGSSGDKAWKTLQAGFGDLLRMLLVHTMIEDGLYETVRARVRG